jgi:Outer membrane protein beta-barrel domain
MRRLFVRTVAAASLLTAASAAPAAAQIPTTAFEITPLIGYVWGGAFPTAGITANNVPAGRLVQQSGLGWGVEVGYTPNGSSWFELTYLRQDSDINWVAQGGGNVCPFASCASTLAVNYIHAGGRWEFGHKAKVHPFLGAGLGVTIFDLGAPGIGSSTDFSISGQAGVRYMFGKAQRVGLRGTFRGWWSFVPNGQVAAWCGWYGCFAQQASSTVAQGEISGGLVIQF